MFAARKPQEWRKLIAYSRQWPTLAAIVLARVEERAAALASQHAQQQQQAEQQEEGNGAGQPGSSGSGSQQQQQVEEEAAAGDLLEQELELRRLGRRLAAVHAELEGYRRLAGEFRAAPPHEWESLVVKHRAAMGTEFFKYLDLRVR